MTETASQRVEHSLAEQRWTPSRADLLARRLVRSRAREFVRPCHRRGAVASSSSSSISTLVVTPEASPCVSSSNHSSCRALPTLPGCMLLTTFGPLPFQASFVGPQCGRGVVLLKAAERLARGVLLEPSQRRSRWWQRRPGSLL